MSKRFSESGRWDDPWYRSLKPYLKNFWDFICMRPDAAGVWKPDWEDIKFRIGSRIEPDLAINAFNDGKMRVNILKNGYWQVLGWVEFQFGENLNDKIGQHRSSIALISKYRELGYLEGKSYPIPPKIEIPLVIDKKEEITKYKHLENDSFKKCFREYIEMRKKIRKPATKRAEEMALEILQVHSIDIAIKMINQSILNSWQGIFPLKTDNLNRLTHINKEIPNNEALEKMKQWEKEKIK